MQEQRQGSETGTGIRLCGVFLFWFVLLTGIMTLGVLVAPDIVSGLVARAAGVIPLLIAALLTGQSHARRTGAVVPSGLAWKLAVVFTLVNLGLSAVVAAFMLPLGDILGTLGVMFAILVGFVSVVAIVAVRLLINTGARSIIQSASP